jgi:hypothetical protein
VVSLYPYVQFSKYYPVGVPEILIHEYSVYGPYAKYIDRLHVEPETGRNYILNRDIQFNRLNVKLYPPQEEWDESNKGEFLREVTRKILSEEFFGYIEIDGEYRHNVLHPAIPVFYTIADGNELSEGPVNKCLFSLTPMKRIVVTTIELKAALKQGFIITEVYRIDNYQKSEDIWKLFIAKYMRLKIQSSKSPRNLDQMIEEYRERFGMDLTGIQCELKPAYRQTFKIILNSLWGKWAQRTNFPEHEFQNMKRTPGRDRYTFDMARHLNGKIIMSVPLMISEDEIYYTRRFKHEDDIMENSDLSRINVALAGYVPAWGRLTLLEQLSNLGTSVLMHDTDSIIAVVKKSEIDTRLPPNSTVLGDWEMEDYESKYDILEFCGLAPKSYAMKLRNKDTGEISYSVKVKGIRMDRSNANILNYQTYRQLCLGEISELDVPSFTFKKDFKNQQAMRTVNFIKKVTRIRETQLKGKRIENYLVPYGWKEDGNETRVVASVEYDEENLDGTVQYAKPDFSRLENNYLQ